MKFSIVITTYNRLELLKRAIYSALGQTVPCEVVVADDCSSDGTQDYVEGLRNTLLQKGDSRLIYHRNAKNQGHSVTMNAGVEVASGDWIKPIDDDDYLAENCIEQMLQAITVYQEKVGNRTSSQAVICSCQAAQVNAEGKELSRTRIIGPGKVFYIPQEDIHYGMLLEQIPFGTPIQVAYQRSVFIQSGGWDVSLDVCDDIDSWIRIAQFGDAIFINQCLAYRTIWPGAYNQSFSIDYRLKINILMKEKIHALVHQKHKVELPKIQDIQNYLKLHWSFVALKQKKIAKALQISSSALFSRKGWKIFLSSLIARQQQKLNLLNSQVNSHLSDTEQVHSGHSENKTFTVKSNHDAQKDEHTQSTLTTIISTQAWKILIGFVLSSEEVNGSIQKFVLIDRE